MKTNSKTKQIKKARRIKIGHSFKVKRELNILIWNIIYAEWQSNRENLNSINHPNPQLLLIHKLFF